MNDTTPLENFSTLDNWAPATPAWHPFVSYPANAQRTHEVDELKAQCS
jgi:hypothetical protein